MIKKPKIVENKEIATIKVEAPIADQVPITD